MSSERSEGPEAPRSRKAKKRTRSGCLPCRQRKRKCDETRPRCRECIVRGDTCVWGLKVSFHPSRSLELPKSEQKALSVIERRRRDSQSRRVDPELASPCLFSIVDETPDIVNICSKEYWLPREWEASSEPEESADDGIQLRRCSSATRIWQYEVAEATRHTILRGEEVATSHQGIDDLPGLHDGGSGLMGDFPVPIPLELPPAPFDFPFTEPYVPPFFLGQAISRNASPTPEPSFPLSQRERIDLITSYLRETATWCETTDSLMHFSVKSAHELMESAPYLAAAMSLASRQRDTIQGCHRQRTLELYQYTIRLLLRHDPAEADASILATCTVLCVYEMMASNVSEWRRHLRGCAGLLRMRGWNGNSTGIVKTCFWAFARIDVWAAFITGQTTLIPTDSWVHEDSVAVVASQGDVDDYCNLVILLFARIINLLHAEEHKSSTQNEGLGDKVQRSWEVLQHWREYRPRQAKPLLRLDEGGTFPTITFAHSSSICANTFYHAGCILLLETGLVKRTSQRDIRFLNPFWHAKELGGISTSSLSTANWVNHLQPLYIAGQVFGGVTKGAYSYYSRQESQAKGDSASYVGSEVTGGTEDSYLEASSEEYIAEKVAILKHLTKIEKQTGWKTSQRAKDLRVLWEWEN